MADENKVKDVLLGVVVGDALGVPVEFIPRKGLQNEPVTGMRAYGTHRQPAGTWSDDSSLTFCLAEMLCNGYDLQALAERFVDWKEAAYWTAHGEVFDIGIATSAAIYSLQKGVPPLQAGGDDEHSNGNGSLMRILPLLFYIKDRPVEERYRIIGEVSSLTHRHVRSVNACFIYLEMARQLLLGKDKWEAYRNMARDVNTFLHAHPVRSQREIDIFHRILENPIGDYVIRPLYDFEEEEMYSTGYVLHTLEASLWCLLHTDNYADAVLKAVNLGHDTDTTGAVTGGLAGILYGRESIPEAWLQVLARRTDIEQLADRLYHKMYS
ncbi:ADP-ribosylglycohydrolase family protein [Taibaiella koreensis]|uniref:ADP-ribosylglycohydrolase family protein n=1 Tax=Taibaiella koreensis TaxID=1268548 RepID=UPI000E5993A8|nr:ADP-ribosylglycohydrolase family protein [Taibaiella koreensis]